MSSAGKIIWWVSEFKCSYKQEAHINVTEVKGRTRRKNDPPPVPHKTGNQVSSWMNTQQTIPNVCAEKISCSEIRPKNKMRYDALLNTNSLV